MKKKKPVTHLYDFAKRSYHACGITVDLNAKPCCETLPEKITCKHCKKILEARARGK